MKNLKITKGEWFIYNEQAIKIGIESMGIDSEDEEGNIESVIVFGKSYADYPEVELANARLISAAPDLLEACRLAITALDMHDKFGDDIDARHAAEEDAFHKLNWALKKAGL